MKIGSGQMTLVAISSIPLAIGTFIAASIIGSNFFRATLANNFQDYTIADLLVQSIVSVGIGVIVVLAFFWFIERRGSNARRVFIALIVSPMVTLVFFALGQSLLLILLKGSTTSILPSLLSLVSLGVFMMSIAFIVMDAVPRSMKNAFVAFYGTLFGAFLAIVFATSSMVVLILSLIAEDFLLTRFTHAAEEAKIIDSIGSDPFDYTRIQTEQVAVGVGDFITFSLISVHSLLFFPIYVWLFSTILALLGIIINVLLLSEEGKPLPGIPLPGLLALFPWMVHIITLATFVS